MQNAIKYLVSPAGTRFNAAGVSSRNLSITEGIKGNIGETSIRELLSGKTQSAKGWKLVTEHIQQVKRANKLGVEFCGTGKKRERKPMNITCSLTDKAQAYIVKAEGDRKRFLQHCHGMEYSALAEKLGWSRDYVAIYASWAEAKGLLTKQKISGRIG